ncbi:helix-turn-helix domain-containing protein [Natrinema sp. SYSU A 869]|uniref:helix-turn-helix domain-containing protein n=1 Tax=Natrinema sp. SYSU A 869 TaxID=2871694 RepID=UPI001CA44C6A|nr:helix-turn-helix domain-containing protein [Natrinema sp. SYSU A 869]
MSSPPDSETVTTALDVLAEPRRRYLLATLLEYEDTSTSDPQLRAGPMPIATLATEVATSEHDCPIVTDDQCEQTHITLVHAHVPRLVDIGVLARIDNGDATTVALADHPILETEWVRTLLDDPTGDAFTADEATLNRTLEVLRSPRRRAVCAALATRRGTISVSDLAAAVVAREEGDGTRLIDVTKDEWTAVATALAHEHLPALSDAGLVEYDETGKQAAIATDAPQWESDWLLEGPLADVADLVEEFREPSVTSPADAVASNAAASETPDNGGHGSEHVPMDTCETIKGTENVFTRGHEIADGADEELVVTIPDGSRIGRKCLERWRTAAERGVDVYVGSRSPRVRDTVRSAVPDATVCEPQFDWLNFPIEEAHHGHVVFADRERALLVTSEESESDEELRVGALAGDGQGNALVSILCDHLGPRLDRLTTARDERDVQDGTPHPM